MPKRSTIDCVGSMVSMSHAMVIVVVATAIVRYRAVPSNAIGLSSIAMRLMSLAVGLMWIATGEI